MTLLVNIYFIFHVFNVIFIIKSNGFVTIISSKPNNVTYEYKKGIHGESNLHQCNHYEACNIVHDRFWMPILTERLCQCIDGKECPWQWTNSKGNKKNNGHFSMTLNNKSALKFCQAKEEFHKCHHKQTAATVYGESNTNNTYLIAYNATIHCLCPKSHYWKLIKFTYEETVTRQIFKCVKKRKCQSYDFCGHIRADLYSTYYRCTCPMGHLCVFRNKTLENVQELLYSGPAYKAYCLPS
ncbi:uncharacterized protein [Prorops nasuta]|uniref:uncharacterized protein n=1 Tax=Prorops nasuta TaxID=863751 RepID=UPI0034CD758E